MIRMLVLAGTCVAAAGLLSTVQAQSKEDTEKALLGFYIAAIAIDACDLDISKDQQARLDRWTEWAEDKLKVSDRKLDKTYSTMEKEVEKDKEKFCQEAKPATLKMLKELPKEVP